MVKKKEKKKLRDEKNKEKGDCVIDEAMSLSRERASKSISQLTVTVGDWQLDRSALFIKQIRCSCPSNVMK